VPEDTARWEALRAKICEHGLRNSLIVAIAPTATIASIAGCYECIEPQISNLFKRETLSGDFLQVNLYLVSDLKALGLWNEATRVRLKLAEGSVQSLDELPPNLRALYRTAWEIPMRSLIDMAADRGAFIDRSLETDLDPEIVSWLSFATDKLDEIVAFSKALDGGSTSTEAFDKSRASKESRRSSKRVHDAAVFARLAAVTPEMTRRKSAYASRREAQKSLSLPLLPTTTIGSFPQTAEVRTARAEHKAGKRDDAAYESFLRAETERTIRRQEEIGLDVLVHGEFERNDMVEYFGEKLAGFAFTKNGWVQSYGSRCVKPPIIYGDVSRPEPMTVTWSRYAQSLTNKPMKGMLTGPVTILQWSFVRVDQPRKTTCRQIALAIRDEVADLERAGLRVIQIDEPAIREGLPLRRSEWKEYLEWAVDAFRLAPSSLDEVIRRGQRHATAVEHKGNPAYCMRFDEVERLTRQEGTATRGATW